MRAGTKWEAKHSRVVSRRGVFIPFSHTGSVARRRGKGDGGGGGAQIPSMDDPSAMAVDMTQPTEEAPDPLDYVDGIPAALGGNGAPEASARGGHAEADRPSGAKGVPGSRSRSGSAVPWSTDPTVTVCDLDSVRELLGEVEADAHRGLIEILRGHTFVGMVGEGQEVVAV